MNIEARLYATLARQEGAPYPGDPVRVNLRQGAVVGDLLVHFALRPDDVRIVLVNGRPRPLCHPLADGDRVALFPPLGGG